MERAVILLMRRRGYGDKQQVQQPRSHELSQSSVVNTGSSFSVCERLSFFLLQR